MDSREAASLDSYITGNYGEDQLRGEPVVFDCPICGRHYEEDTPEELLDITQRMAKTGFCCEWCEMDNGPETQQ